MQGGYCWQETPSPSVPILVTGNRTLGCGANAGQGPALGAWDLLVSENVPGS